MNALNPFTQPIPDSVSATLNNADATLCRFNRGRTLYSGQYLAVAQLDGPISIWDVETRTVLRLLEGHVRPVSSISWSACNRYLASASADWNVIIWDLAAPADLPRSNGLAESAGQGQDRPPDNVVEDAYEQTTSAPRARRKRTIRFDAPVTSAEFAPDDSRRLLVVLETQEAFLVDIRERVKVRRRRKVPRTGSSSADVGGGELTYDEVPSPPIRLPLRTDSSTTADEAVAVVGKNGSAGITAAKYSPHSDRIFAGTSKGLILTFDAATAELVAEHKVLGTTSGVKELAFDRTGKHLVVNTNDRAVRILNVVTSPRTVGDSGDGSANTRKVDTELVVLHKYQDLVNRTPWNGIGFSGDSDYVVGGAAHKSAHNVYIWDRSAGTLVKILEGPKDSLVDVDWHPERPLLASVSNTGAIYIWFTATEEIWSAYAPGFEELEENVEYPEREDEFDLEDEEEVTRRKQDEEEALVNVLSLGPAVSAAAENSATSADGEGDERLLDPRNLVPGTDSGWREVVATPADVGKPDLLVGDQGGAAAAVSPASPDPSAVAAEADSIWQEREATYYIDDDDRDHHFVIPPCLEGWIAPPDPSDKRDEGNA